LQLKIGYVLHGVPEDIILLITKTLQTVEVTADEFNINIMHYSCCQRENAGDNEDGDTGNYSIILSTATSNKGV
jgi:hypothetical protein